MRSRRSRKQPPGTALPLDGDDRAHQCLKVETSSSGRSGKGTVSDSSEVVWLRNRVEEQVVHVV